MTNYTYDSETFRLTRQRSETYTQSGHTFTPNGTVHHDTGYDYDLSGNILRIKERVNNCGVGGTNSLDRVFNHDPLYRLLSATGRENSPTITPIWDDSYRSTDHEITTAYTQHYEYDLMGNIQRLQHVGNNNFTRNFNYGSGNNNKLQGITAGGDTYSFTYDANGNQITENSDRKFEWDFADKLRSFRVQAGTSQPTKFAHYLYDAGGNRVKKLVRVSGGSYTSTTYIDGIFEKLTDGTDTQNTLHVMDDNSRIATVRLGEEFGDTTPAVKYVLEDHLGNSTFEVNGDGTFIAKEEYYPFGETSFASYGKKRYKYNGKERDDESGLYNYGMRYYSAWTCRFISVDPLFRDYAYYTPYQYAGNKPINFIDMDGLEEADQVLPNSVNELISTPLTKAIEPIGVVPHFSDNIGVNPFTPSNKNHNVFNPPAAYTGKFEETVISLQYVGNPKHNPNSLIFQWAGGIKTDVNNVVEQSRTISWQYNEKRTNLTVTTEQTYTSVNLRDKSKNFSVTRRIVQTFELRTSTQLQLFSKDYQITSWRPADSKPMMYTSYCIGSEVSQSLQLSDRVSSAMFENLSKNVDMIRKIEEMMRESGNRQFDRAIELPSSYPR